MLTLRKAEKRQIAFAKSGGLDVKVTPGGIRPFLRLDPMVDANLSARPGWGAMWHKDKDKVNWVRKNHPETVPVEHADRIQVGHRATRTRTRYRGTTIAAIVNGKFVSLSP